MSKTLGCGCVIYSAGSFTFCPLHEAAPKLLSVLEYTAAFLAGVIEGERIPTGIRASARVQVEAARTTIIEAGKMPSKGG